MLRIADRMTLMSGTIEFPSLPGLLEHATQRVVALFASLGRPCSPDGVNSLRTLIKRAMEDGYQKSSDARVVVNVEAPEGKAANFEVGVRYLTTEERYKTMQTRRPPPLFGKVPDAMVLNTAGSLGEASQTRVLDVGAGTGRNAIPLAGRGHPVTAVESRSRQPATSPLSRNGMPQTLKLGNRSSIRTSIAQSGSVERALSAAAMPASLPPTIRMRRGLMGARRPCRDE